MRRFAGRLVVAGGFVTGAVVHGIAQGSDIDMFVVARTPAEGDAIVNAILLDDDIAFAAFTGCALTMSIRGSDRVVQIVTFLIPSLEQVVAGFDFDPARALAVIDPDRDPDAKMVVKATRTWLRCAQTRTFRIDTAGWTSSSVLRVSKYCAKGYRAFVPGLDRSRVSRHLRSFAWMPFRNEEHAVSRGRARGRRGPDRIGSYHRRADRQADRQAAATIAEDPGFGSLFVAEWLAQRPNASHAGRAGGADRWSAHRHLCKLARTAKASDYASLVSAEGVVRKVFGAIGAASAWLLRRRGIRPPKRPRGTFADGAVHGQTRVSWRTFAPEKRLRAVHAVACDQSAWCLP